MLELFSYPGSLPRLNRRPLYLRVYLRQAEGPGRPAVGTPGVVQVGDNLTFFDADRFDSGEVKRVTTSGVETAPLMSSWGDSVLSPGSRVKFENFYSIVRRINDPL